MTKKALAILLALSLVLTACIGFAEGVNETTIAEKAKLGTKVQKVTEEPVTLSVWVDISGNNAVGNIIESMNDMDLVKAMEEKTGVHLEFTCAPIGEAESSFSLMIASGKYPDIIMGFDNYYKLGGEAAIEDGILLDLKDLVEKYAPNYKAVCAASDYRAKNTVTDSGKMPYICSPAYQDAIQTTYGGPIIRQDLLDKLGMTAPVTYDDWYTYLSRCVKELGLKRAFGLSYNGICKYNGFNAGFGFAMPNSTMDTPFYQENGQVKFAPLEQNYKDYLTMMAKWYADGLIDPDFTSTITFDDGVAMMSSGECAGTSDHGGLAGYINSLGQAVDPNFNFVAIANPVKTAGETLHIGSNTGSFMSKVCGISTTCKNPEIAVAYIDQYFTDEGFMLCNYGTEGKTYTLVDGMPVYTDLILNNPKGTITDTLTAYASPVNWFREVVSGRDDYPTTAAMAEVWDSNDDYANMLPNDVSLTTEEKEIYSDVFPEIKSYVEEMTVKFIMGLESFDNYDAFVQNVKDLGIQQVIDSYQAALERYLSR